MRSGEEGGVKWSLNVSGFAYWLRKTNFKMVIFMSYYQNQGLKWIVPNRLFLKSWLKL